MMPLHGEKAYIAEKKLLVHFASKLVNDYMHADILLSQHAKNKVLNFKEIKKR